MIFLLLDPILRSERSPRWQAGLDRSIYLIPDGDIGETKSTCFKFDRGLQKVGQSRQGDEGHQRGPSEAMILLLQEGADKRRG